MTNGRTSWIAVLTFIASMGIGFIDISYAYTIAITGLALIALMTIDL